MKSSCDNKEIMGNNDLQQYQNIVIYGAGIIAREVCFCLKEHPYNLKIDNFMVSNKKGNPESIFGIPVVAISDYDRNKENTLILIAVMDVYYDGIMQTLKREKFNHILSLTFESKLWGEIREKYFIELFRQQGRRYLTLEDVLREKCDKRNEKSITIYRTQCHMDKAIELSNCDYGWETPIQAGAAFTDQCICDIRDNEGDNISFKNKMYSELTALYWIWKNDFSDYVGLCHYRRHFDLNEDLLNELTASDIDVVLTVPILDFPNVREIYIHDHIKDDWEVMLEAIKKIHPEYLESADELQNGVFYYGYNMLIAKKEILDVYCEWLFPILFYCEEKCKQKEDVYQNRYIGFLAERLLSIYFLHNENKYKIVHAKKKFLS